jgi:hypothetical protein
MSSYGVLEPIPSGNLRVRSSTHEDQEEKRRRGREAMTDRVMLPGAGQISRDWSSV